MGVQINGDTGNISAIKADYSGNVTIGGTLTYEDVTNIDSVGLVTARTGIEIGARPGVAASISVDGNMIVSGITTLGNNLNVSGNGVFSTSGGDDAVVIKGDTYTALKIQSARDSSDSKAFVQMHASRGTNASPTIVQNGDIVGTINARAYDGNSYASMSDINFEVDGAPGDGDMPGRIVFKTSTDGSQSPSEKLRITNAGALQISGADDQDNLLVKGVGTGFAVHQDDTDGEVSLRAQDVTGSNNAKFMTFFVQKSGEATSEAMRISNTRKVGIATVSPNAQLHILTTNEAGILIEDSSNGNNAPYLEVMGKRTDANIHQSFSGQLLLSRNRTEQKISSGLKLGSILFGGNHTNGSKSNIAFPASIAGISTGNFDDVNNMPTALTFYTGFIGRTRLQSNVSSGVERMRISPEGYITKPYQPACTAHQMASAINTNGESNYTEVVFTQTITNRGSHYNTSNGRFTCPVSGVYHVSAGFLTRKGSATNAYHNAFIYKNGSNTGLKTRDINNANELHITVAGLIDCNAGQYLSVYVSNDGGDFWSDYNYFSVHLVG